MRLTAVGLLSLVFWLPFAQVYGRAYFNVLAGLLFIGGMIFLLRHWPRPNTQHLLYWLLLPLALLPGIILAGHPETAWPAWWKWTTHMALGMIWFAVLHSQPEQEQRWLRIMVLAYVASIGLLYVRLGLYWWQDGGLSIRLQLLSYVLPGACMLPLLWTSRWRWPASFLIVLAGLVYVWIANDRAVLAGLLLGGTIWCLLHVHQRWLGLFFATGLTAVALFFWHFFPDLMAQSHLPYSAPETADFRWMNAFTSGRIRGWINVMERPPDSLWFGVGMAQTQYTELMQFGHIKLAKMVHNLVFDAYYETGLLGLTALLVFIGYSLRQAIALCYRSQGREQAINRVFCALLFAILGNSMLGMSYGSRDFSTYFFLFSAWLLWRARNALAPDAAACR